MNNSRDGYKRLTYLLPPSHSKGRGPLRSDTLVDSLVTSTSLTLEYDDGARGPRRTGGRKRLKYLRLVTEGSSNILRGPP